MDRRSLGRGSRLGEGRPAPPPPTTPYRADAFALSLPPGWADATTYTIVGPVVDGLAHHVIVTVTPHDGRSLDALADIQVQAMVDTLPSSALLLRDLVTLDGGARAIRTVVRWSPMPDDVRYQQQVYAVVGDWAVAQAAAFTARSRRLLGPDVHRLMLSLSDPSAPAVRRSSIRPHVGR